MHSRYDNFRNKEFIKKIAPLQKWTVSTSNKVPIDIQWFKFKHMLRGAEFSDDVSLLTLDEVNEVIPNAANYTFYLDAVNDKICVLDIEPTCPQNIKDKLLQMPCLYAEKSMSGKGVHMVFNVPLQIWLKYEDAVQKIVFKEEHGWYEILLNHYVTFTANELPYTYDENHPDFDNLFEDLASKQKKTMKADIDFEKLDAVTTKFADTIVKSLIKRAKDYKKTPMDFHNDMSKYEFGYTASIYRKLEYIIKNEEIKKDHEYTDSEKAWLIYSVTRQTLPYRAKHDEERNDMPWLLYLAADVIARCQAADEEKEQNDKLKQYEKEGETNDV